MRSGKLLRKRKKIGHFDQNFEPVANCNENKGGNLCKKRLELYNKKQKKNINRTERQKLLFGPACTFLSLYPSICHTL